MDCCNFSSLALLLWQSCGITQKQSIHFSSVLRTALLITFRLMKRQYIIVIFTHTTALLASHRSLLHEAGQEFVDVCASLQEVFGRLLRFLLSLVGGNF